MALGSLAVPLAAAAATRPAATLRPWQAAWGRTLQRRENAPLLPAGSTYGETCVSSLAGQALRLRISNEHGRETLAIAALRARVDAGAWQPLQFGGVAGVLVPGGAPVLTDPLPVALRAGSSVEIRLVLERDTAASTYARRGKPEGAWIVAGPWTDDAVPVAAQASEPLFLSTLEIQARQRHPVLVILGDTKSAGAETWPTALAARAAGRLGVVNRSVFAGHLALGPVGDSAIARLDRDALGTAGVTHVLVFAGNNDLIQPGMRTGQGQLSMDPALALPAEALATYLGQCVARIRAAGLVAVGATWLPYEGVTIAEGYSTPAKLAKRNAVNRWIRAPGAFDIVIDFDRAMRDDAAPDQLASRYDEGNHFTPNGLGYARMADEALSVLTR
jgi:lysophospholipase L1-like esterase